MWFLVPVALVGLAAGTKGGFDVVSAKSEVARAGAELGAARRELAVAIGILNEAVQRYEQAAARHRSDLIEPMAGWINRHAGKAGMSEEVFVATLNPAAPEGPKPPGMGSVGVGVAAGLAGAVVTGMSAPAAITALVGMFGTASTGTALSSLSGAAATNATLAAIGGGSIASGGGGMVAGAALLQAAVPVVGMLAFGAALLVVGERSKSEAADYCAKVACQVQRSQGRTQLAQRAQGSVEHLESVLGRLADLAAQAQQDLFKLARFDPVAHGELFIRALATTRAVAAVMSIPLLDPQTLQLNPEMLDLLAGMPDL